MILGNPSFSHQNLALQTETELIDDLSRSQAIFKDITGHSLGSLSFPYGGPKSTPLMPNEFYEQFSIVRTVTMQRGINDDSQKSMFNLKRISCSDIDQYV